MNEHWQNLKKQLDETTERWKRAADPETKDLLGGDVRELERLIEIAAAQDTEAKEPLRILRKLDYSTGTP
jgi:hypothetical protein